MNTPITKVLDIIPDKLLDQPFDERAFYENVKRFALLVVPVGTGIGLFFSVGVAVWAVSWFIGCVFISLGVGLACVLKIIWDAYHLTNAEFKARRDNHDKSTTQYWSLWQSLQMQTINVKSGAIFNNTGTGDIANVVTEITPSTGIDPINETYNLALKIVQIAIESYKDGKRPKPKPFSAEVITAQFRVGREKWMEAVQMISDAGVLLHPDRAVWTPLVKTFPEGEGKLKKLVESQDYYRDVNKKVWIKK